MSFVFISSYTKEQGKGISTYAFDQESGQLTLLSTTKIIENPSYLCIHPQKPILYTVSEVDKWDKEEGGGVASFQINTKNGELFLLESKSSGGADPCHLIIDSKGQRLFVSNYSGGSLSVFSLDEDGRLGNQPKTFQYIGKGFDVERQEKPHIHSVWIDPHDRYAYAADLGLDRLVGFHLCRDRHEESVKEAFFTQIKEGQGPRHFTGNRKGTFLYLVNELGNTVDVMTCDKRNGHLECIQSLSTLPSDFKGKSTAADIHLSPDERFLYCSNRGSDSIGIFSVDSLTGRLKFSGHESSGGIGPRSFALDSSGSWLIVTNELSQNAVIFKRNKFDGRLIKMDQKLTIAEAVCVKFYT